jgi:hypothetical protein
MNLQENIRKILREEERYDDKVGRIFWFEYHCYESPNSCDAEIWYRSHQKVKVIGVSEWSYDDKEWRQEDGNPRVYLVEWGDGYQYDVFEDELMESPDEFHRLDSPERKIQENIRRILRESLDEKQKIYYGFEGLPNFWVDDSDRNKTDKYFEDKDYKDYYFDNFYDMDNKFGHNNSLFGTRGLPVGHPSRSSKSFDIYNKRYGSVIVRVIKESTLKEELTEARVPKDEKVRLYKDDNIIVVVPLTHRALQKYATNCQWCINDDKHEWEDYHKERHAVIIQRNPKKGKKGITGMETYGEIFLLSKLDSDEWDWKSVVDTLGYDFGGSKEKALDYYVDVSNDINNFATNIVYYSPENGIYDMEDNFLWNYGIEIKDVPNVTPKVIEIMDDYLWRSSSLKESNENQFDWIDSPFGIDDAVLSYLEDTYPTHKYETDFEPYANKFYIVINGKTYSVESNKKYLTNKLSLEITDVFPGVNEPILRRTVRHFLTQI